MSEAQMTRTPVSQPTGTESKAIQIEHAESATRSNPESGTPMLQLALQNVTPSEAASVYRQVASYDADQHQQSLVEMSQGHLTIPSLFSKSELQPTPVQSVPSVLDSLENKAEGFVSSQGDMWNRVLSGKGSWRDDTIAALEGTAAISLAVAAAVPLAEGVAAMGEMGSFGILGYSPLTAALSPSPVLVFPASMSMFG
jgi:hypothetical protein